MYKTRTVNEMVAHAQHIKIMSPDMYKEIVTVWRKFAKGDDGGHFEPWNPRTIRETYYSGWKDEDFAQALNDVGESNEQ